MKQIPQVAKAIANAYQYDQATAQKPAVYSFGTADVAAIIRARLATVFPGIKFWVRSHCYAGGSSIDVYFDGQQPGAPAEKAVNDIARAYSTKGFDGMIDMAYGKHCFMMPDGSIVGGSSTGTLDNAGSHPGYRDEIPAGAFIMRGGADYIFTNAYKPWNAK